MDEPSSLEDTLSSVCADLLSERRFEPFVRRVFAARPGSWLSVAECCEGLVDLPDQAAMLYAEHA